MKILKKSRFNRKGFTLIEFLLYISITSVILTSLSVFLAMTLQSRTKNQTIAEVEQSGAQILSLITQTVRNSQGINSPVAGANSTSLSLDVIDVNQNPTVFSLSGSSFQVVENATVTPLSYSRVVVSNLNFSNFSRGNTPGTIQIEFTLTRENPSGRNEFDYQKTFIGSAGLRKD
jgi:Tfp pilus assembly protein PilW